MGQTHIFEGQPCRGMAVKMSERLIAAGALKNKDDFNKDGK